MAEPLDYEISPFCDPSVADKIRDILGPSLRETRATCPDCDGEGGTHACRCHGDGLEAEGCHRAVWMPCAACDGEGLL